MMRGSILFAAASASSATHAADAAAASSFAPGLIQTTLGLALVLALIWGAARLTRRFSPALSSSRSPIKLIAAQALAQRERVVLIELGDEWLLLGVAPGHVTMLHATPKGALPQSSDGDSASFAKLFAIPKRKS